MRSSSYESFAGFSFLLKDKGMRLIYVDSRNRVSGTASNFSIQLNETLSVPQGSKLRVDQIRVPIAFQLINANNRYLFFQDGDHTFVATLEIGGYSSPQLAATLQYCIGVAQQGAHGPKGTITVQYQSVSSSTQFLYTPPSSNPGQQFFILSNEQIAQLPFATFPGINLKAPQSINDVLGGYATSVLSSGQTQLMFPFISTQPYDSLYLTSTRLSTSAVRGPRGNNNVLAMIIITEAFGNVQENAMPYDVWLDCSSLTTLSLDFQLVDRFGVPVDLTLGGEILFLLTIDEGSSGA